MKSRKTALLALVLVLLLSLFAACGGDTVIATYKGRKIYLGEYADFIEFNRRLDLYEKRAAVENGLRFASYLSKKGVTVTDGDVATALRPLENKYFEGDAFASFYKDVAAVNGADLQTFKKALKNYAAAIAAAAKFESLYGENAAALTEGTEHHVVCKVHVAHKAHSKPVFRHERKVNAKV